MLGTARSCIQHSERRLAPNLVLRTATCSGPSAAHVELAPLGVVLLCCWIFSHRCVSVAPLSSPRRARGRAVAAITAGASLGRGWGQVVSLGRARRRCRPWRKRHDSVPVSMMCARWVRRSTTAFASRGSGNTLVHSPNGSEVVIANAARSLRSDLDQWIAGVASDGDVRGVAGPV